MSEDQSEDKNAFEYWLTRTDELLEISEQIITSNSSKLMTLLENSDHTDCWYPFIEAYFDSTKQIVSDGNSNNFLGCLRYYYTGEKYSEFDILKFFAKRGQISPSNFFDFEPLLEGCHTCCGHMIERYIYFTGIPRLKIFLDKE